MNRWVLVSALLLAACRIEAPAASGPESTTPVAAPDPVIVAAPPVAPQLGAPPPASLSVAHDRIDVIEQDVIEQDVIEQDVIEQDVVEQDVLVQDALDYDASDDTCCKVCHKGKACGDTCVARNRSCTIPAGCACDG